MVIFGGSQLVKSPLPRYSIKVLLSSVLCLFWLKTTQKLPQRSSLEMREARNALKLCQNEWNELVGFHLGYTDRDPAVCGSVGSVQDGVKLPGEEEYMCPVQNSRRYIECISHNVPTTGAAGVKSGISWIGCQNNLKNGTAFQFNIFALIFLVSFPLSKWVN